MLVRIVRSAFRFRVVVMSFSCCCGVVWFCGLSARIATRDTAGDINAEPDTKVDHQPSVSLHLHACR